MSRKTVVIIGAGPAGLTAALELVMRTQYRVIVLEAADGVGGISRTFHFRGNHIDIGGHRFFSKSQRVMDWWQRILPIQAGDPDLPIEISYQNRTGSVTPVAGARDGGDNVMLVRNRVSRILYRRRFFDYPLALNARTVGSLGIARTMLAGLSFLKSQVARRRPERTLEDYIVNRFGRYLYEAFFRDYTRKVWGVPCEQIPADWGAQRIKGLSITGVLTHAARKLMGSLDHGTRQQGVQTSLIERFLYPKYGPGQMWEEVARRVVEHGGELHLGRRVTGIGLEDGRVRSVTHAGDDAANSGFIEADVVFSTMPISELAVALGSAMPPAMARVATTLPYRDFMTVGLLLARIRSHGKAVRGGELQQELPDNWIYIQEPDVLVGRLQVFNNWSPFMVADPDTVWVGLEYFLNVSDALWQAPDAEIIEMAAAEMTKLGFIQQGDLLDAVVIRQPKAYPAYFGAYEHFDLVKRWLLSIPNLALLGRNGQHRYNNQDHSMLTAMLAVDLLVEGRPFDPVWDVNTEAEFHEQR